MVGWLIVDQQHYFVRISFWIKRGVLSIILTTKTGAILGNMWHLKWGLINSVFLGNQLTPVRYDRDNFVQINELNIDPNLRNNFEKRPYGDAGFHTAGSLDPKHTPYDVLSAIVCEKEFTFQQYYYEPQML